MKFLSVLVFRLFLVLFGLAKTPLAAAIYINLENVSSCLVGAGFSPNMIEVGGRQTATMNAVGNTVRCSQCYPHSTRCMSPLI